MKSFELLLTVLFIIIVYLVTSQKTESNIVVGIISVLFVILWIECYNMCEWDYNEIVNKTLKICNIKPKKSPKRQEIEKKIKDRKNAEQENIVADAIKTEDKKETELITKKVLQAQVDSKPKSRGLEPMSSRPKALEYSENNYKKNLFDEIGSLGDNKIAHLMKHVSNKNRVAIDNMARQNKYTNINYFEQELKDHANSIWWDNEKLEQEF